jgi:hypothetical protein
MFIIYGNSFKCVGKNNTKDSAYNFIIFKHKSNEKKR